ncbi:DUF3858 domain-containing protein [Danxiaibacter flavus]|uniref:DUF3858 domain-containing protein n=1 Tax=Danxiaibacter flavus TaxID=3049108 RepID=A0ABV3ZCY7_9BACT|nr:DUF3858 domain-containing protein [Chitinophagaceae bacterium DXS]
MKTTRICALLPLALCLSLISYAQKDKAKYKFGDIKPEDFAPTVYSVDSSANAVILADVGETVFEGNSKGNFSLIFTRLRRTRLLNKNSFDNEATVEIPLYVDGSIEEKLEDIDAVTYNLEDGKIVATKLDKASLFKDKASKNWTSRKFTFPNIKEGSIIEYRYKINSPYYSNLRSWNFQGSTPRLWSEYSVTIPSDIFDYVVTRQGYLPYAVDTVSSSRDSYHIMVPGEGAMDRSESFTLFSNTVRAKWAIKDVPPIKGESFITTIDNYLSKIDFQLRRIKYSATNVKEIMGTWYQFAERLVKDESFGEPLGRGNGWLSSDLKAAVAGASTDKEKAEKIYAYIRDNFTCKTHEGFYITNTLKKAYQDKSGNVGDINLLLVAAYRNQGFEATPALLSTRDNGYASESYPLLHKFNYVVCRVKVDDQYYMLDATNNKLGFGKLPLNLYNKSARIIDSIMPALVPLESDSLLEKKTTMVFINEGKSKKLEGSFTSHLGYFESLHLRENGGIGKGDDFLKELKKRMTIDVELSDAAADSIKQLNLPVDVRYNMKFDFKGDDIVYFNPMLTEATLKNPFESAERKYPVEMPYRADETYIFNMPIPEGYKVDELPKSARVKLNDTDGMFEYIIMQSNNSIQLRSRIQLNKAVFGAEDYSTLRDFFNFVVSKQGEQIVFKKI